jgi:hypothetical protein
MCIYFTTTILLKLVAQYTNVERLEVTLPGRSFQMDYGKLYGSLSLALEVSYSQMNREA